MDLNGVGGVWPAAITPFTAVGNLDEASLQSHLRDLTGTPGVRAVVVNGHAGEVTSLDREERRRVVQIARTAGAPACGIVAGIVADDTRGACLLARDAADAGADALLLFPPALFANGADHRPDMAVRHAAAVADASGLPITLFQLARSSGLSYGHDTLLRLCREVPAIIAVKEGSDVPAVYEQTMRALRSLPRRVSLLTTNNSWLFASLAVGADGLLSGLGSVAPGLLVALFAAVSAGDLNAAREVNAQLFPLVSAFYRPPFTDCHSRMKVALHLIGKIQNAEPRPPLLPILPQEIASIGDALRTAGLLPTR
jgi:4-hydroxy-tetrahydrodipicolinate synthase